MSAGQCIPVSDTAPAGTDDLATSVGSLARHHVSVAGVIIDTDDRVLAIRRRDDGAWELPGGVLELDEELEEGLAREVKEEAGVIVDVLGLSGVYKHMGRGIVALVYQCALAYEGDSDWVETVGVRWMDRAEVVRRMDPLFAARVFDALEVRRTRRPVVRHHDGRSFTGGKDFCLTVLDAYRRVPEPVKKVVQFARRTRRRLRPRPHLVALVALLGIATVTL